MLFSSFNDVIWIDTECFPLHAAEKLLEGEPYRTHGLTTGHPQSHPNTSASHVLRASSETGEVLLSKSSHVLTLLLPIYYNY